MDAMNAATRWTAATIVLVCAVLVCFAASASPTPGKRVSYAVGYSLYNTPVWGRAGIVAYLSPYTVLLLTCWKAGAPHSVNGQTSRLYYGLSGGGYVNAAWVYTGTTSVIRGVRPCSASAHL
jgi:hypothetical protein